MTGTPLVPSFVFGSTRQFTCWYDPWGFIERFSRKIRFPFVIFWGRYGAWIPYRAPQTIVFGSPIPVEKSPNGTPTEEEINAVHDKLVKSIIDIYNQHKEAYGYAHRNIKIL